MKTIKSFNISGKKVLVRCDFNVPLDDRGNIRDDFRIIKTLPTIQYLIKKKAKIILMSHLGEPNGIVVENLKLDKVKEKLEALLGAVIKKTDDCIGKEAEKQVFNLKPRQILLLENLRFHKEESNNDLDFAKQLADFSDIYINDAFSDCHRNDASIVSVPKYLPHGMGLLLQNEIEILSKVLKESTHPIIVLVGGIKGETKVKFINEISEIADFVLTGGLIKKKILEKSLVFKHLEKIIGSVDNLEALDISENTIKVFKEKILKAKTIIWNGPFGKFEDEKYKNGTLQIAKAIIKSKAFSVVGGGQTVEFLRKEGMLDKFNHVSTGGGAMLDYLSGGILPGLKTLENEK